MASTAFFLHCSTPAAAVAPRNLNPAPPSKLICRAHKRVAAAEEEENGGAVVSRRLALTLLIGAAAVGSKVSPAEAAYGQTGIT